VRDFKNTKNFEYELFAHSSMELRSYQLEGVKWLGFLVKYMLNGALCDDMGLGKTLQTLTVIEN
jgi:TATA-binding protein-associated factor